MSIVFLHDLSPPCNLLGILIFSVPLDILVFWCPMTILALTYSPLPPPIGFRIVTMSLHIGHGDPRIPNKNVKI